MKTYEEEIFDEVTKECKKYGYSCQLSFDRIVIISKYEAWYFVPKEHGFIKLMHGDTLGTKPSRYHKQFCRKLTIEQIIRYIHEHEVAKFEGKKIVFSFSKSGYPKYLSNRA